MTVLKKEKEMAMDYRENGKREYQTKHCVQLYCTVYTSWEVGYGAALTDPVYFFDRIRVSELDLTSKKPGSDLYKTCS
jgi:hypothetical protein